MENTNSKNNKKIKAALEIYYSEDVRMNPTYRKNLDKLVDNTIKSEEMKQTSLPAQKEEKNFFRMIFTSAKWQASFLMSFLGLLLIGGIGIVAFPGLREKIFPSEIPLHVISNPGNAEVLLRRIPDESFESIGITPLNTTIEPGSYDLQIRLSGYEAYSTNFTAESGKPLTYEITLKKSRPALDLIKEWKTYSDLTYGFELTYPLKWSVQEIDTGLQSNQSFQPFEIVDPESKLAVYPNSEYLEFKDKLSTIEIAGKQYLGITNYSNWNYVIVNTLESANKTNTITLVFYSMNEAHSDIYDFIRESATVFERQQNPANVSDWNTLDIPMYGLSLKYPVDWISIEKSRSQQYGEFHIQPAGSSTPMRVIYSAAYLQELDEYLFDTELQINGMVADRYLCGTCEGKFLYSFENRIYVIYQTTEDLAVNEQFEQILETVEIIETYQQQDISDYSWSIGVTIPEEWQYRISNTDELFDTQQHAKIQDSESTIDIYLWDDIREQWKDFTDSLDITDGYTRGSQIKIAERTYTRFEIWTASETGYALEYVLYLTNTPDEADPEPDPKVIIGETTYVVLYRGEEVTSDVENIPQSIEERLGIIDAIVASLEDID